MTEYLRVQLTSERLTPKNVPRVLESLYKLTTSRSVGIKNKLNPFSTTSPPRFEFLAISEGPDDPVEFYYGVDAHIDTLEKRLRSIYPPTFDIERVDLNVFSRIIKPVLFTKQEFIEHYEEGLIQYEFSPHEKYDRAGCEGSDPESDKANPLADGGAVSGLIDTVPDHHLATDDSILELAPPDTLRETEDSDKTAQKWAGVEKPTLTPEGMVLARPTVDATSPLGVQWYGSAARKKDWMTSLKPFTTGDRNNELTSVDKPGAALASLVDHLMEAKDPVAFQVVFQRRSKWEADAKVRTEDLAAGRDTIWQKVFGSLFGAEKQQMDRDKRELNEAISRRIDHIEAENPRRSFKVNIRAVGVPVSDSSKALDNRMDSILPVFDQLDGPFYEVEGKRLREKGLREKTKLKNSRAALRHLLNRELETGRGRTRPDLVLGGPEIAHFVLVPSSSQLTIEGQRGTRAEQRSQNPLPLPNPDLLQQFQHGMTIGHALDENSEPLPTPVRVPPELLTTHYGRFASTGSGKSKSIINDALSLRRATSGPVVIVDPKGDGMTQNYLRCHYEKFGDLEYVYHFRVPETLPAVSFFDIRPALEAGQNREDAVQDKVDHFHEILRMIMGRDLHEQAFVANEILSYLIKALFDKEYGSDVFGLDDLFHAALEMQRDQTIPLISADNQEVEESLTRHFAKDDRQFQVSMDAVGNRLDKLREDAHLRRIFSHTPETNNAGEYIDNHFDFREFIQQDATILFDLGALRPEAQRALTLLLLSNLWDAVQVRRRDGRTDYDNQINLIIEEAAPIASTKLVSEQLLPQGRSFGLGMGLVMQFPEQVQEQSLRAYDELLNNIKTKLIGDISIEPDLAESLAHEDLSPTELRNRTNTLPSGKWIAQLPDPSFGEAGPRPFSLQSLPIAPGHPESDQPLSAEQENQFESVALPRMVERTQSEYAIADNHVEEGTNEDTDWGGSQGTAHNSGESSRSSQDYTQSTFIGQAISDEESTSDGENQFSSTNSESDQTEPNTPLFGGSDVDDKKAQATNGSQPGSDQSPLEPPTPIRESDVPVTDEELEQRGLSRDDVRFLSRVLDIMNQEDNEYTLLDSMRPLKKEYEDASVQRLVEKNLIEGERLCRRYYYTVLPAGRDLLGQTIKWGIDQGDIGEKTPHKVGVKLLELWIQQQEQVEFVRSYYECDDQFILDVAGFDENSELVWAGEVEFQSNNVQALLDDYDKLDAVDANVVWAFNKRKTAKEVLDHLYDCGRIDMDISEWEARKFESLQEAVNDIEAAGITTVQSLRNIDQEVNS